MWAFGRRTPTRPGCAPPTPTATMSAPETTTSSWCSTRGGTGAWGRSSGSPRAVQADGVFNEAQFALGSNPDDLTPDFAWEARTAIGDSAWTAELRIPFTSLRYPQRERQTWGVIVQRVYPRELTHSLASVRLPRGTTCFLCHEIGRASCRERVL